MKIKIAKQAGFCCGVKKAVDIALNVNNKGNVYSYGELIHNSLIIKKLQDKSIKVINEINEIPDNSTVIIRSHGIGKNEYSLLNSKHCEIVDCTCDFVKKIHTIVKEHYENGYDIIIIGLKDHAEVKGINGWCNDSAQIIETKEQLNLEKDKKYCVVVQTTFNHILLDEIFDFIKNNVKTVEFFNTICYTTQHRQFEAIELSKNCDAMIVIGDKNSSNTLKLFQLCSENCQKTFLITDINDLYNIEINKINNLGITAGASTPKELIEEVIDFMSNTQEDGLIKNEENNVQVNPQEEAKVDKAQDTMENLLQKEKSFSIKPGKRMKCKIISSNDKGIFVELPGKKDGFIDKEDASLDAYNPVDYKKDDVIEAIIVDKKSPVDGTVSLSKKIVDEKKKEDEEIKKMISAPEFNFVCDKETKGGLSGRMGSYSIFVPASQIKIGYVSDLSKYVGKSLRLRIIENKDKEDVNNKKMIASQRIILEEEKKEKEDKFWNSMVVGEIYNGKVKRIKPFGAFVSVNGNDCLVHISDISWTKINDPSEILEINKSYDFKCLKVDRENNRVSLGYKQLQKTPYEIAIDKYPVGTVVKGKVERIFPYGAFISIEDGVDGLVHVSQICHEWIKNASDKLKVGDEVQAKVISFEGSKITLSIKDLLPKEEFVPQAEEVKEEVAETPEIKVKTRNTKEPVKPLKREKRVKKSEDMDDLKEWVSDNSTTTSLADLFKDFSMDSEEKAEIKTEEKKD